MPGTTRQSCSSREGLAEIGLSVISHSAKWYERFADLHESRALVGETYKRLNQLVCRNRKVTDALTSGMKDGIRNVCGGSGPSRLRRCRERGAKLEIENVDSRHIDFA